MPQVQSILVPQQEDDATIRIQAALDHARDTPVRVVLAPGRHICRGLRLPSNAELNLPGGAELHFVPQYEAYAHTRVSVIAETSDRAMIVAEGARNVALTGTGHIVCSGTAFSLGDDTEMGTRLPARHRPRLLVLDSCSAVRINGIHVENSPMWTLHLVNCEDVAIDNVVIDNDRRMPNTDGMVIDACRDVTISGCSISTADDGIVLKTSIRPDGRITGACERIRVSRSSVSSNSCALKIGTESFGSFDDISFEDCTIPNSNRALGIFSRDGGNMNAIRFARIGVDCRETPNGFWGSGEALTLSVLDRRPAERPAGKITNVTIEDVSGQMQGAINFFAEHPGGITGVAMVGIRLDQQHGALGTALSYDLRPTPADLAPSSRSGGRMNAWRKDADGKIIGLHPYPGGMPGLFAHNVAGLDLTDIEIVRPDPLPKGFNADLIVRTGKPAQD